MDSSDAAAQESVSFTLYVSGNSERSLLALDNLRQLCRQHLGEGYEITVIDAAQDPRVAITEQLLALPALDIRHHGRKSRLVGDLSLAQPYIVALGMAQEAREMRARAEGMIRAVRGRRIPFEPGS